MAKKKVEIIVKNLQELKAQPEEIVIKNRPVIARSENQKKYIQSIINNVVTIAVGEPGTGKTSLCVGMALDFLIKGKVDRIIVTRPVLEATHERLGFLPGAINEKMDPYIAPIYDELEVYLDKEAIKKLLSDKKIIVIPLAFMRGRNLKGFIILDEAQNATKEQLKLFLTRLCPGSKAVLNGDIKQSDLPLHLQGDFDKLSKAFNNVPEIGVVHLDRIDNNRHEIVPVITEIMENMDKPRYLENFQKNKFYNDDELGSYEDRVD